MQKMVVTKKDLEGTQKELDAALLDQIRTEHDEDDRLLPNLQRYDREVNQPIFREMVAQEFEKGVSRNFLLEQKRVEEQ